METPIPYENYFAYLEDLKDFALSADEQNGTLQEKYTVIQARCELTTVFLPPAYLAYRFCLDEAGKKALYLLAGQLFIEPNRIEAGFFSCLRAASPDCQAAFSKYLLKTGEAGELPRFKERIIQFILTPDEPLQASWLTLYMPGQAEPVALQGVARPLQNLAAYYTSDQQRKHCVLWLHGKRGSGRSSHIKHLCNESNLSVLFVNLSDLCDHELSKNQIQEVLLESILTGALICLNQVDIFFEANPHFPPDILFPMMHEVAALFFVTARHAPSIELHTEYNIASVAVPLPSCEERLVFWQFFVRDYAFDSNIDIPALAERFALSPLQIKKSIEDAHNLAVAQGEACLNSALLFSCCRKYATPALLQMGQFVPCMFSLADLVLPTPQKNTLLQALDRAKKHNTVYEEWCFHTKVPYGKGLSILLCGQPGTGKTMAAQVFAHELQLSLFKIDLPAIVSKFIGETEKNLKHVFDEAKEGNMILFFDEADSFFGKRTEIKDAHDRNANMEVSYLLQRLEEYEGIVILASNIVKNMDEAFKRRFQFIIDFPFPDKAGRESLWRKSFPASAPVSGDLDYTWLSEFKMTGSTIKSCVLSAAFIAAAKGCAIDMSCLIAALCMENEKSGLGLMLDADMGFDR